MRLADNVIHAIQQRVAHTQGSQVETRRLFIEQTQDDTLAVSGRQRGNAHVHAFAAQPQRDTTVLRQTLFGNIEVCHDFQARHQRGMQRARRLDDVAQHAVQPEAHDRTRLVRLKVNVGNLFAQSLQKQRVDHPDHRRLRVVVEQIFAARHFLEQLRKVGVARQFVVQCQRRTFIAHVIGARQRFGKAFRAHFFENQFFIDPLFVEYAPDFLNRIDRRVAAHQCDDRIVRFPPRQNALRFGKSIRNACGNIRHSFLNSRPVFFGDKRRHRNQHRSGGHRLAARNFRQRYFAARQYALRQQFGNRGIVPKETALRR